MADFIYGSAKRLGFYLSPREPRLAEYALWLQEHGVRHVGTSSILLSEIHLVPPLTALIRRHNLHMVSVHAETGLLNPAGDDADLHPLFLPALERASVWGAGCVVFHFRSIQQPWKPTIWWEENAYVQTIGTQTIDERMAENLKWLCREAAQRGLSIALENVPMHFSFGYQVDEILRFVRGLGIPNLGLCLDSGHAHLSGIDVPAAIRCAGSTLLTTHFHDTFSGLAPRAALQDCDLHLVPGLGTIDWPDVIRALKEIDYSHPIVFEGPRIPQEGDGRVAWELTMRLWRHFEQLSGQMWPE